MTEKNNARMLANLYITLISTKLGIAISQYSHQSFDEKVNSQLDIQIKYRLENDNPNIHVDVRTPKREGTIGIWLQSRTMDISIWDASTGDSFYEFHDTLRDISIVENVLEQAITAIQSS